MEEKILGLLSDMNQQLNERFDKIDQRLDKIDQKLERVEQRLDKVEQRLDKVEQRLDKVEQRLDHLESDVDILKTQQKENTSILKSLVHSAEINKAEHDKMTMNMAVMNGSIIEMRKSVAKVELITAENWSDLTKIKSVDILKTKISV